MYYMIIFWIIIILAIISHYFLKNKKEDISLILIMLAVSFLIVAIVTKDPIFAQYGIPAEFEWVVGLFVTFFTSWLYYFNPLKKRIIKIENKIGHFTGKIDANLENLKSDINLIKNKLMNK